MNLQANGKTLLDGEAAKLMQFIRAPFRPQVCAIIGWENTAVKALIKLVMTELDNKKESYMFIDCTEETTWEEVEDRLAELYYSHDENTPKYVFINEITQVTDFVKQSAVLADVYAHAIKIILTGTNSITFYLASLDELYDRVEFIHLPISAVEFESIQMVVIHNVLSSLRIARNGRHLRFHSIKDHYTDEEIAYAIKTLLCSKPPYNLKMRPASIYELECYLHFLGVGKKPNALLMILD